MSETGDKKEENREGLALVTADTQVRELYESVERLKEAEDRLFAGMTSNVEELAGEVQEEYFAAYNDIADKYANLASQFVLIFKDSPFRVDEKLAAHVLELCYRRVYDYDSLEPDKDDTRIKRELFDAVNDFNNQVLSRERYLHNFMGEIGPKGEVLFTKGSVDNLQQQLLHGNRFVTVIANDFYIDLKESDIGKQILEERFSGDKRKFDDWARDFVKQKLYLAREHGFLSHCYDNGLGHLISPDLEEVFGRVIEGKAMDIGDMQQGHTPTTIDTKTVKDSMNSATVNNLENYFKTLVGAVPEQPRQVMKYLTLESLRTFCTWKKAAVASGDNIARVIDRDILQALESLGGDDKLLADEGKSAFKDEDKLEEVMNALGKVPELRKALSEFKRSLVGAVSGDNIEDTSIKEDSVRGLAEAFSELAKEVQNRNGNMSEEELKGVCLAILRSCALGKDKELINDGEGLEGSPSSGGVTNISTQEQEQGRGRSASRGG